MHGCTRGSAGLEELTDALERYRASGTIVMVPYLLGLRAQLAGTTGEASAITREAITLARTHGEMWCLRRLEAFLDTVEQEAVT